MPFFCSAFSLPTNPPALSSVPQAALAPVLLRRMKEDVEDLPEKEEVVIWVELTAEQRRYGVTGITYTTHLLSR